MEQKSIQIFKYYKRGEDLEILNFLSERFPYLSRELWHKAIVAEKIKVNQAVTLPSYMLHHLDEISYERDVAEEPPVDKDFTIIFEDEQIVAVDKGGNLPVSISGRYYHNTLIEIVKVKLGLEVLYPVHRIDKETSGIVVFAKTKEAATYLGNGFANAIYQKEYHCILHGKLSKPQIIVDQPLARNNGSSLIHIRQVVSAEGKQATTEFNLVQANEEYSFCQVKTLRGRTHQIRCHAEFIKHPIVGDKLYGQTDQYFLNEISHDASVKNQSPFSRQLLHASRLQINHPRTEDMLIFNSNPLPHFEKVVALNSLFADFSESVEGLTDYNSAN